MAWGWLLSAWLAATGPGLDLPNEIEPFVLPGHAVLELATGDLDGDGRADAVLVLKRLDEDEAGGDEELPRPLLVLVRQPDGRLRQAGRNDKVVYCSSCGGVMGDPFQGVEVAARSFTVEHYGGSAHRWGNAYTFAYDAARRDWFVEREHSFGFHAMDPEGTQSEETLTREQLGDLPLGTYDPLAWQAAGESRWRVTAEKARFYDRPDPGSAPRKAYLVKGDVVKGQRELRLFVQVEFEGRQGRTTSGYVLKQDLEPLAAR